MSLALRITPIEESGPVVRIAPDTDLDALLLELAGMPEEDGASWSAFMWGDEHVETPTQIGGYYANEGRVGWYRWNPCSCGDHEHTAHIEFLGEERPEGSKRRGAWFGVWFE